MNKNILLVGLPLVIVAVAAVTLAVKSENDLSVARREFGAVRSEVERIRTDRLVYAAHISDMMQKAEYERIAATEKLTRERDEARTQFTATQAENEFAKKEIAALREIVERKHRDCEILEAEAKREMDTKVAQHRAELEAERAKTNRTVAEANSRVVIANNAAYLAQRQAAAQPSTITVTSTPVILRESAYEQSGVVVIEEPVICRPLQAQFTPVSSVAVVGPARAQPHKISVNPTSVIVRQSVCEEPRVVVMEKPAGCEPVRTQIIPASSVSVVVPASSQPRPTGGR